MLLSHDKHVSFCSIYMGKLLKLSENFFAGQSLLDIDTEIEKEGQFPNRCDAIRYFPMKFHDSFVFFSPRLVLMFDVTQFPCFVWFPFTIQFSFYRKIWQKWHISSRKILSHAQQCIYTVTHRWLINFCSLTNANKVSVRCCCSCCYEQWINFAPPLRHC